MKIAILAHSIYPIKQPYQGGLEKFIHVLATELSNQGIDVTLYCHEGSQEGPYKKISFTNFNYKLNDDFTELNKDYTNLVSELKVNNYDLIHNNTISNEVLELTKYNTPVLTTIHVPPIDGFRQEVYKNFLNKNCYINHISEACLKSWNGFDWCKVIHNGIDVDKWNHNLGERYGAIWFGRICPEKGVEIAIKAANASKLDITIAGIINDEEYFKYLKSNYSFTYTGLCNHKELNYLIATSKVFIKAPKWQEPFGLVYLESLACGTPVATVKSNIARELLNKDVAVITEADPKYLGQGALQATKLNSNTCREYVKKNFDISTMVDNYIKYYLEILNA